jgi:hypothetical protein
MLPMTYCCTAPQGEPGIRLYTVHPLLDGDLHTHSINLHNGAAEVPGPDGLRLVPLLTLLTPWKDVSGSCAVLSMTCKATWLPASHHQFSP